MQRQLIIKLTLGQRRRAGAKRRGCPQQHLSTLLEARRPDLLAAVVFGPCCCPTKLIIIARLASSARNTRTVSRDGGPSSEIVGCGRRVLRARSMWTTAVPSSLIPHKIPGEPASRSDWRSRSAGQHGFLCASARSMTPWSSRPGRHRLGPCVLRICHLIIHLHVL